MSLREFLNTKTGTAVELLCFFIVAVSPLPVVVSAMILIPIAIISLEVRKTEWKEIGFDFKDFKIRKIALGITLAVLYYFANQYLFHPIISKFAQPGLPEIFSMKGDVAKYLIGLLISWTTAAFVEELLFRGYLISRMIDLMGENIVTKIIIILLTGIVFGFVHSYQGLYGAISTAIIGVFQGTVFFLDGKKLTIPIIAHGAFDTIGFTMLFIG